jgi:transcriptional regulator GlxA family with amidase domain
MPRRIAFVLFPDFQQLDIAGPLAAFEIAERIRPGSYAWRFVARQPGLVRSSSGPGLAGAGPAAPRPLRHADAQRRRRCRRRLSTTPR